MSVNPFRLVDPELAVPSALSATQLEFWARLNQWADDREAKVGRATLSALALLATNPPHISGLAQGDFWSILSKFMSRGFTPTQVRRLLDEDHLRNAYDPHLGDPDNVDRLLEDLGAVEPGRRIALSGVSDSWLPDHPVVCAACESDGLSHLFGFPNSKDARQGMARAYRLNYLDEHPSDASSMPGLASDLFPNIEFSSSAWSQLGTLVGAPADVVTDLIHHLGVLSDLAGDIWRTEITTASREAALGSLGVTASLEGPKTHKNKSAMKKRDFQFKNGQTRCEWHAKMKPHTNRIYFAIEGEAVLVGAIVDHLPV